MLSFLTRLREFDLKLRFDTLDEALEELGLPVFPSFASLRVRSFFFFFSFYLNLFLFLYVRPYLSGHEEYIAVTNVLVLVHLCTCALVCLHGSVHVVAVTVSVDGHVLTAVRRSSVVRWAH